MRVLAVTNMWPTPARPAAGALVAQQVVGLRRAGVEIEVLHADRLERGMRCYAGLGSRCRAAAERADVVHAMYGGILADIVTSAARGRPTVVSFCGSDLLGEPLAPAPRRLLAWAGTLASRRAARRAARIVVKSRNLARALGADARPERVHVIPNGVDLSRFRPLDRTECRRALGWDDRTVHVLFPTTNGAAVKRRPLAAAALAELERTGVRAVMRELTGVPHADVPLWINACDALLLTSAHEGSPNVVKEALACGVPIVSVDVGDVRERIAGLDGCRIAEPDPRALAAALREVLDGPRRIDARAQIEPLSLEHVSARLVDVYRRALAQPAAV
ncbi:MAG TPA: glycosyltransferase [Vicinamibacterales bacterium]